MPPFDPWTTVTVPFPYTDRSTRQRRPAVVISGPRLQEAHGLLWVAMITSAENAPWADDVPITLLAEAGLPAPSVCRAVKVATIQAGDAVRLGRLAPADSERVARTLGELLARA